MRKHLNLLDDDPDLPPDVISDASDPDLPPDVLSDASSPHEVCAFPARGATDDEISLPSDVGSEPPPENIDVGSEALPKRNDGKRAKHVFNECGCAKRCHQLFGTDRDERVMLEARANMAALATSDRNDAVWQMVFKQMVGKNCESLFMLNRA